MACPIAWGLVLAAFAGAARGQPAARRPRSRPPSRRPSRAAASPPFRTFSVRKSPPTWPRKPGLLAKLIAPMDLGELSKVLLLEDWRVLDIEQNNPLNTRDEVARIRGDLQARDDAVKEFLDKARAAMKAARDEPTGTAEQKRAQMLGKAATIALVGGTVDAWRRLGNVSQQGAGAGAGASQGQISYLDQQLAGVPPDKGITPDLIYLLTKLQYPDSNLRNTVRQSAAQALGAIHRGSKDQVPEVVAALGAMLKEKGSPPDLRLSAAQSLQQLSQAAADEMQHSLNRDENIRECYLAFARVAPTVLGDALSAGQPVEVSRTALNAYAGLIGEMLDISIVPLKNEAPLLLDPKDPTELQAYKDRQARHYGQVQEAFADFGKTAAFLADAARNDDPEVCQTALTILANLAVVRDRLQDLAAHPAPLPTPEPPGGAPPPETKGTPPEAARPIVAALILVAADEKSAQQLQQEAYEELAAGLDKALPAIVQQLGAPDPATRRRAVDALELFGPTAFPAVDAITLSLRDPDKFARWAAARTLGELAQEETGKVHYTPAQADAAVRGIARLLHDEDLSTVPDKGGVRIAAVTALTRFGPRAAFAAPVLTRMLNRSQTDAALALVPTADTDPDIVKGDPAVRVDAFRCLEAIGGDEAVNALPEAVLALQGNVPVVQEAAADFIGVIGPNAAEPERRQLAQALGRALSDPETDVRRAAGSALMRLTQTKAK